MWGGRSLCMCGKSKHFKTCSYLHFSVHQVFKFGVRGENYQPRSSDLTALTSLEEEMMKIWTRIQAGNIMSPTTLKYMLQTYTQNVNLDSWVKTHKVTRGHIISGALWRDWLLDWRKTLDQGVFSRASPAGAQNKTVNTTCNNDGGTQTMTGWHQSGEENGEMKEGKWKPHAALIPPWVVKVS